MCITFITFITFMESRDSDDGEAPLADCAMMDTDMLMLVSLSGRFDFFGFDRVYDV